MKRFGAALLGTAAVVATTARGEETPPIIVYYYSQWAAWNRNFCADQFLKDQRFRGTTHIQYAFHAPDESCKITTDDIETDYGGKEWSLPCEQQCNPTSGWEENQHHSPSRGNVGCLAKVKKQSGIKVGISLGGWTLSKHFSPCVTDAAKRKTMIDSILHEIDYNGWDFVDFDWEYPHGGGNDGFIGKPTDWDNFIVMITELRAALAADGKSNIGLTGAFGMNPNLLLGTGDYSVPTPMKWLCDNLEFVSLMTYDLGGGWVPDTIWPAALYHDDANPYPDVDRLNIDWELRTWKEACGANFNKVILGLPSYGKSWSNVPAGPDGNGMYQTSTMHNFDRYGNKHWLGDGSFTDSEGTLETWDIEMNYVDNPKCKHYFNDAAKQDFMYCPGKALSQYENIFFAYDGPEVFYEKVKRGKELGVGGLMVWDSQYVATGLQFPSENLHASKVASMQPKWQKEHYYWTPYEDAMFDAWAGKSIEPHRSKGIRVGNGSSPPPVGTTAAPPPGSGGPKCDEVTSASAGSVSFTCASQFCTLGCNKSTAGECSDAACVEKYLLGHGYTCKFA